MANYNNELKVTSFTITIEAPMHKPLVLFKGRDTHQWEEIFINLRDNEKHYAYKRNYDRCRALLKFAYSCWGSLKEVSNGRDVIIFTFEFDSIEGLSIFEKELQKAVEGATM